MWKQAHISVNKRNRDQHVECCACANFLRKGPFYFLLNARVVRTADSTVMTRHLWKLGAALEGASPAPFHKVIHNFALTKSDINCFRRVANVSSRDVVSTGGLLYIFKYDKTLPQHAPNC